MSAKLNLLYLFLFSAIVAAFIFTRLYKISETPGSLYWDEASIGYNAYSLVLTGKDEWGEFLPIHFRAFGEFKLPVYVYSVAVTVKFLGLSALAVRLPAVVYSLGFLIVVHLIVQKLTQNKWLGLLSMFFLTTSPWFFIFSRTGYEATAGLFFFACSFYLFQFSFDKKLFFLFSILLLLLSFYSYNSFRIISPISFIVFSFLFLRPKSEIKSRLPIIIFSALMFLVCMTPFYRLIKNDYGLSRLASVQERNIKNIFTNYLSHFSINYFTLKGDSNLRSHVPGAGQIWVVDLLVFFLGIKVLLVNKGKFSYLVLFLFFFSFVPAAITKESPHALRSLPALFLLSIIWANGAKPFLSKKWLMGLFAVLLLNSLYFSKYFVNFLMNYNSFSQESWQYEYKEIFTNYKKEIDSAEKVIVTDKYAQPYIFALFYSKFDPKVFQNVKIVNSATRWGESTILGFDKFEFREATSNDLKLGNLVFTQERIAKEDREIKLLDNKTYVYVYFNR